MKSTSNLFRSTSLLTSPVNIVLQVARLAIPAVFSLAMTAQGANIYWDGSGSNQNNGWANANLWSTSATATTPNPGAVPGSGDIAIFSISSVTTAQIVQLDAAAAAAGLTFLGTNTATTTLLGGGANQILTLGASGITVNTLAGAVTIGSVTNLQQVAVTLAAAQSWTNNSANTLTVANGVTNGGFLLTLAGTGNTSLGGIVSGTGGLTMSGSGATTLSAANTFTGLTTVSAGTLSYGIADALSSGAVTVSGGTLAIGTFSDTVGAVTLTSGSITGGTGVLTGTSFALNGTVDTSVSAILGGGRSLDQDRRGDCHALRCQHLHRTHHRLRWNLGLRRQ